MEWSEEEDGTQEGVGNGRFQDTRVGSSGKSCREFGETNTLLCVYCLLHCTKLVKHAVQS